MADSKQGSLAKLVIAWLTNVSSSPKLYIEFSTEYYIKQTKDSYSSCSCPCTDPLANRTGNALARVQRVHKPADLWDIIFCTR